MDRLAEFPSYSSLAELKSSLSGKPQALAVVVVCASAERCLQVLKECKLLKIGPLAKLFARHMKLTEQVDFVTQKRPPVGVGTPNRVLKLVEYFASDALILIDLSVDSKKRCIVDMKDTQQDVFALVDLVHDMRPEAKIVCLRP